MPKYRHRNYVFVAELVLFIKLATAEDSGDTSTSNLFSDLAPLLALFGEQFAKQYMSQSIHWLDNVIFALAPLGIITAVVGAIRAGGPMWLKALIGRARENRATVEIELMSSTSNEVGEVWNGQSIVRTMGKPELKQIIYLGHLDDPPDPLTKERTFGLHTLETARENRLVELHHPSSITSALHGYRSTSGPDLEQKEALPVSRGTTIAPNVSFNIHGKSPQFELYTVALCGIILQFGVLVFEGFIVYHPRFKLSFKKNGATVLGYAYPMVAAGTLILMCGMIICAAVIEESTEEEEWEPLVSSGVDTHPTATHINNESSEGPKLQNMQGHLKVDRSSKDNPKAYILWLQRNHVVSDQSFDTHVLFAKNPRSRILTSRRRVFEGIEAIAASPIDTGRHMKEPPSRNLELYTVCGTLISLVGFILQFQGLRGMHWSASIAQMGAIAAMTVLRAWLRRRLIEEPIFSVEPNEHEMDSLALWLSRRFIESDDTNAESFWPKALGNSCLGSTQVEKASVTKNLNVNPLVWKVCTGLGDFTTSKDLIFGQSDVGLQTIQSPLLIRQRLGKLTNWVGPASQPSISIAGSIEIVMNTLFSPNRKGDNISWVLNGEFDSTPGKIQFHMRRIETDGKTKWTVDSTAIESALSLWIFNIKASESRKEPKRSGDWLRDKLNLEREAIRIVGKDTDIYKLTLNWWTEDPTYSYTSTSPDDDSQLILGFSKFEDPLVVKARGALEVLLAQHIFSAFMWAAAKHFERVEGQTTIANSATSRFNLDVMETNVEKYIPQDYKRLEVLILQNQQFRDLAAAIKHTGLGSLHDTYSCLIPPLFYYSKLSLAAVVDLIRNLCRSFELRGEWWGVFHVYKMLFELADQFDWLSLPDSPDSRRPDSPTTTTPALTSSTPRPNSVVIYKVTGILIDVLQSIKTSRLGIKRKYYMQPTPRKRLLSVLAGCDFIGYVLALYRIQHRFDIETWEKKLPSLKYISQFSLTASGKRTKTSDAEHIHTFFGHDRIFIALLYPYCYRNVIYPKNARRYRDILGWTPLHYAAAGSLPNADNVRFLLDHDHFPNSFDIAEWTPLHYVIDNEHSPRMRNTKLEIIALLLEAGAGVGMRGRDGIAPLHCASRKGNVEAIDLLISRTVGLDLEITDNQGRTPLHWAALCGRHTAVKLLLDSGARINSLDKGGNTPAHLAALNGMNKALSTFLEDAKFDKLASGSRGDNLLHSAAMGGKKSTLSLLIKKFKFDVNVLNKNGETPLHRAVIFEQAVAVRFLVKHGINLNIKNNSGDTALHHAARSNEIVSIYDLVEVGADLNAVDNRGNTALHLVAARSGIETPDLIRALAEAGADVNAVNSYEDTVLFYAVTWRARVDVIHLLAELGADLNAPSEQGFTALHYAAHNGWERPIHQLIELGANPNLRNHDGDTPLQIAVRQGYQEVVQILQTVTTEDPLDATGTTATNVASRKNISKKPYAISLRSELRSEYDNGNDDDNDDR